MKIHTGVEVQINQLRAIHIQGLSQVKTVMNIQLYNGMSNNNDALTIAYSFATLTSIAEQPHRLSFFRLLCCMNSFW